MNSLPKFSCAMKRTSSLSSLLSSSSLSSISRRVSSSSEFSIYIPSLMYLFKELIFLKKRLICLLLVFCMVFSLCACAKDNAEEPQPSESATVNTANDRTVYVSQSGGKIHRYNDCSGMKYYDVMTYSEAIEKGFDLCQKCYG